mmetsp:Transcript_31959/g.62467  ORF Transcript_31959/g.62467 Transcript_31959/m.62467 type:complete len:852 (-) Transcript_31959:206-2761(-)
MGNDTQYQEGDEPRGYVAELNIVNSALQALIVQVLATYKHTMPHCVVPLEATAGVAIDRLVKQHGAKIKAHFRVAAKAREEAWNVDRKVRAAKRAAAASTAAPTTEGDTAESESNPLEEEKTFDAQYKAEDDDQNGHMEDRLDELKALMTDTVKASEGTVSEFLDSLKESTSLVVLEPGVEADGRLRSAQHGCLRVLEPFFVAQRSLFIEPVDLSKADAETLRKSGTKSLKVFGTFCPVALSDYEISVDCAELEVAPEEGADPADRFCYPLLWGHSIVYCCSKDNRDRFCANVLKYIKTPAPQLAISPSACILGPPCSAKSTLCQLMAQKLDCEQLSIEGVLEEVANLDTSLGRKVRELLVMGSAVPDVAKVQALLWKTEQRKVRCKGWVLDGFPRNENQACLMQQFGVVPHQVFQLSFGGNKQESSARKEKKGRVISQDFFDRFDLTRKEQAPYEDADGNTVTPPQITQSGKLVDDMFTGVSQLFEWPERFYEFEVETASVCSYFQRTYDNLKVIDISKNTWHITDKMLTFLGNAKRARQHYHICAENGKPAEIYNIGLAYQNFEENLSDYKLYCPVSWVEKGELVKHEHDLALAVESQCSFYNLGTAAAKRKFMRNPAAYTGANFKPLPEELPIRACFADCQRIEEANCEFQGNCPVSIVNARSRGKTKVVKGLPMCTVSYKKKIYRMASEKACSAFMRNPDKFSEAELPKKMPPADTQPDDLLVMGKYMAYLEQAVAQAIMKAMLTMGKQRVKYPGLSISESALLSLSLKLKASNPNLPEHVNSKYSANLEKFLLDCKLTQKLIDHYKSDGSDDDPAIQTVASRFDELLAMSDKQGFELANAFAKFFR